MKRVKRRDFLKGSALGLAAIPLGMNGLMATGTRLVAADAPSTAAAAAPAVTKHLSRQEVIKRLPRLKSMVGEVAEYEGYVFKGFVRIHVGKATFSVTKRDGADSAVLLRGVADGGKLGYNLHMDVISQLDPETLLPRTMVENQTGSERRFRRFLFQKKGISYLKKRHCHEKGCKDPRHMIKKTVWWGPIPSGEKIIHCPGCKDLKHYHWEIEHRHKITEPYLDMLTALFVARTCDFSVGSSFEVPMVQNTDLWNVKVVPYKEEKVTVAAGTYDCVQVRLLPASADDSRDEGRFTGLFGMNGTIKLWIDKEKRIPVRILGSIPFAFMDLHAEACLSKIVAEAPTPT